MFMKINARKDVGTDFYNICAISIKEREVSPLQRIVFHWNLNSENLAVTPFFKTRSRSNVSKERRTSEWDIGIK